MRVHRYVIFKFLWRETVLLPVFLLIIFHLLVCIINHALCAKFGGKTFEFLFHINFTWLDKTKLILVEDKLNLKLYIAETAVSEIVFDNISNFNGIFYQDQDLKKIFEAFPEMLFVDAVCKCNELGCRYIRY